MRRRELERVRLKFELDASLANLVEWNATRQSLSVDVALLEAENASTIPHMQHHHLETWSRYIYPLHKVNPYFSLMTTVSIFSTTILLRSWTDNSIPSSGATLYCNCHTLNHQFGMLYRPLASFIKTLSRLCGIRQAMSMLILRLTGSGTHLWRACQFEFKRIPTRTWYPWSAAFCSRASSSSGAILSLLWSTFRVDSVF